MKLVAPLSRRVLPALWLIPLVCHFAFSWIGFNPTDEGWLQAVARRLLDGQVPHRDFISVRPILSAALQMPLTAWGGDYLFWLARLWGWLEIGLLAWLWSGFLAPTRPAVRAALFCIIIPLTAHTFPVMAWHTLDGLVLCSLAVALARHGTVPAWRGAFFLAGLATLTRQNFVFFLPFLALGLPHLRLWPTAFWAALAPALYTAWLATAGALPDFFQQALASHGVLLHVAILQPLRHPAAWLGLALGLAVALALAASPRASPRLALAADATVLGLTGLTAALCLARAPSAFVACAFALLAGLFALLVVALARRRLDPAARLPALTGLGLAWCTLISSGYNHPALAAGLLLVLVWHVAAHLGGRALLASPPLATLAATTAALLAVALWHARHTFPYQDRPAAELTLDAGTVLRGARGLHTHALTYEALAELRALTDSLEREGRPYAILTDYSAHWPRSGRRNPLDCEWPQSTELAQHPLLYGRFAERLFRLPPTTVLIVQRHVVGLADTGFVPVSAATNFYLLQERIVPHARLLTAGRFFHLYALPRLP